MYGEYLEVEVEHVCVPDVERLWQNRQATRIFIAEIIALKRRASPEREDVRVM